jgi:serine/threonine protein kinase
MCSNPTVTLLHFRSLDPKSSILINNDGRAYLAGFDSLTIASDQSIFISSCIEGGTTPWMSPELFDPDKFGLKESRPTKESDCYALGMVIYEVLSGREPFAPLSNAIVIIKVLRGERPSRPQAEEGTLFTDRVWGILELCWKSQPRDRISAKAALLGLEGNPYPSRPSSNMDRDAETDSDDQSDTTASESSMFSPFHFKPQAHV